MTPTLYVLVPELIGVPEKTPAGLKLRAALQIPEQLLIAQLYGVVPPVAVREVV